MQTLADERDADRATPEQQADRTRELTEYLERTTTAVASPRGEVLVTVDATGGLAGLQLRPEAGALPLDQLAALVMSTSKLAQVRMAEHVAGLVADLNQLVPATRP